MMNRSNVPDKCRTVLFQYVVATVTKLHKMLVVKVKSSRAMIYLHWAGIVLRFIEHLRIWG